VTGERILAFLIPIASNDAHLAFCKFVLRGRDKSLPQRTRRISRCVAVPRRMMASFLFQFIHAHLAHDRKKDS
jgi:hypothetical protein